MKRLSETVSVFFCLQQNNLKPAPGSNIEVVKNSFLSVILAKTGTKVDLSGYNITDFRQTNFVNKYLPDKTY